VFAGSKSDSIRHLVQEVQPTGPVAWGLLFAFYFACSFIIIFFNAALIFCALQSFAGKEPSLRAGIATAAGRLPQILAWALVAATVGLILNALQNFLRDRLGFIGSLLGGIAETAWAVVTYFVVPVVVVDGVGPVEAVKRSSAILKRTWGEAIGGEGGLGFISILFFLPLVLLFGLLGSTGVGVWASPPVAIALIGLVGVYLVALVVVFTALGTIFRTGAYIYATTGKATSNMDPALLQGTFRAKS
jgi:ABC-type multidrug transport system fused ATPase/permease subunit